MNCLLERKIFLRAATEAPDGDRPHLGLPLADDEEDRHLGEAVLSHLVIDLLVAKIKFGTEPRRRW